MWILKIRSLKSIFEVGPGPCTVVLRRQLLRSFILFYLTGVDCINRLIQCNTGSPKALEL